MTTADRVRRTGRIVAQPQGGVAVEMDNGCAGCSLGCLSRKAGPDRLAISDSASAVGSAGPGSPVCVSVSRSGLTVLSLLAFGPIIAVLLLVAFMADHGFSGGLLLGFAAFMLVLATAVGRALVRPRVRRLLSVDARVIVSC